MVLLTGTKWHFIFRSFPEKKNVFQLAGSQV